MDQIEINIKLASNNKIYNLPIRKSDTILKLKEYCKIISNIPEDQQNLLYKGKILLDEKLINYYNIENDHNIILVKKEVQKVESSNQNFKDYLFKMINSNKSNNKEIKPNDLFNLCNKIPNLHSFWNNIDLNQIDNFYQLLGVGNFKDIIGFEPKEMKEFLKDPSSRDMVNKLFKDPSEIERILNTPIFREKMQNNPFVKFAFQNPQLLINNFQKIEMAKNMFKESKRNTIDYGTEISNPPDPFENLDNNHNMNSSSQVSNINAFNNNKFENKGNFINNEINIDYKEKYKDQLSQLKSMGFTNEEINIQALNQYNGNIGNAIGKILEQNN